MKLLTDMSSYVLTLQSKETTKEFHLWIRRRAGDLISCALLNTQGMTRLDTLENASQKLGQVLLRSISDQSRTVESSKEMTSRLLKLLM